MAKQLPPVHDLPPLELKQDPQLGRFLCVPATEADEVAASLQDAGIRFQRDPEDAVRLTRPGQVTFVFGKHNAGMVSGALQADGFFVQLDPLVTLTVDSYRPPLEQLLRRGELKNHDFTLDYGQLGIASEHIPELIRMATDAELHTASGDTPAVWAPVHAWRALAGLRAEAAIEPLIRLLGRVAEDDDEWVSVEVPMVLGMLGPAALEPLRTYLAEPTHGEWPRVAATKALAELGEQHPELRTPCIAALAAQLDRFADQSETLNAFLVGPLLDLKAVEALPAMARAFAAGRVEEAVMGDYEDVEIMLGLKTERVHPPKPNRLTELGARLRGAAAVGASDFEPALPFVRDEKVGRNDPCPCGSGKKFKKCCG